MNFVDKAIEDYCRAHTSALPPVFDELREATYREMKIPQMQVGLLEGRFLSLLVAITGAKNVLELGTFTGFSALAMAQALPEGGKVITLDSDDRCIPMAREHWGRHASGGKIEFRLGPALETLPEIAGPFDLVFIDADKPNYLNYWEAVLPKTRAGGLIVVDNVLWSGKVLAPVEKSDFDIAAFNEYARQDSRVEMVMLPVRDGILLAHKK